MGSHRVGLDGCDLAAAAAATTSRLNRSYQVSEVTDSTDFATVQVTWCTRMHEEEMLLFSH